ncbi:NUDIX domain-containing protein [Nanoarchaeota archaeon]
MDDVEYSDVVNDQDEVIDRVPRSKAVKENLCRRAVHVFLQNSKGEVLSQLRAKDKEIMPDHWSTSVQGAVSAGEAPDASAAREMQEEIGVEIPLEFIGKFKQVTDVQNEFVYVYYGKYEGELKLDNREMQEVKWFDPEYLSENPDGLKLDTNLVDALKMLKEKVGFGS